MADSDETPCFSVNSKLFDSGTITAETYFSNMLKHLDGIKHDEDLISNELEVLKPISDYSDCVANVSLAVRRVVMNAWQWKGASGFDASSHSFLLQALLMACWTGDMEKFNACTMSLFGARKHQIKYIKTPLLVSMCCIAAHRQNPTLMEACLSHEAHSRWLFQPPYLENNLTLLDISLIYCSCPKIWEPFFQRKARQEDPNHWFVPNQRNFEYAFAIAIQKPRYGKELEELAMKYSNTPEPAITDKDLARLINFGQLEKFKELLLKAKFSEMKNIRPLIKAVPRLNLEAIRLLAEFGMHVNWMPTTVDMSNSDDRIEFEWMGIDVPVPILHWISEFGSLEQVNMLLELGAHASVKDGRWCTAMDWAARRNRRGQTPEESKKVMELLLRAAEKEKEAGVNPEPDIQRTAHFEAVTVRGRGRLGEPYGEDFFG